jgi:hypothetical protein
MGATVQIGLATTASDNNQVNIATFENVAVAAAPNVSITPVSPDPRGTSVSSITFAFDQPVTGFDLADLQLTRASTIVTLGGGGVTLGSSDGGTTWTLGGIATLTGRVGDYTITIADDSITNAAGVPLNSSASDGWVMNVLKGTVANEQMKLVANTSTSTDYILTGAYQYSFNPAALGGPLVLEGGGGTDAFMLDGVAVMLASTQKLSSLTLDHGATIDVFDHDLIIDYAPAGAASPIGAWNGSAYTGLTAQIGTGIFSSHPLAQEQLAGLAIAEASSVMGIGADDTDVWSGYTVDGTTVLIKYTYIGDASFDGLVDASDYGLIDNYYQFPGTTGYCNGDFNYDGVIDASDYGYVDNSFQLQGPPL